MNHKTAPNQFIRRFDWNRLLVTTAVMALVTVTAMLFAMIATSCTPSQRSTMSGAFTTCASADLGALVAPGLTLLGDVATLIEHNDGALETDLDGLAVKVGTDAVLCAIAAVDAVLQPDSGSAATSAERPGVVRARAWASKKASSQ